MPNEQQDLVQEARELLAKATPGPWRAERTSIGCTVKADDMNGAKNGIGLPAFSFQFAKVWETDPNGEGPLPFEANADLIARAPELLRQLCDEVERFRGNKPRIKEAALDEILDCDKCDLCEDHHAE